MKPALGILFWMRVTYVLALVVDVMGHLVNRSQMTLIVLQDEGEH